MAFGEQPPGSFVLQKTKKKKKAKNKTVPRLTPVPLLLLWIREKASQRLNVFGNHFIAKQVPVMRSLSPPQHSSHQHHAQHCPSSHSSKTQSPRGCSCSCRGEKPQLEPGWERTGPYSYWVAHLLKSSTSATCLSSSCRKITGPLLETREALSLRVYSALLLPPVEQQESCRLQRCLVLKVRRLWPPSQPSDEPAMDQNREKSLQWPLHFCQGGKSLALEEKSRKCLLVCTKEQHVHLPTGWETRALLPIEMQQGKDTYWL